MFWRTRLTAPRLGERTGEGTSAVGWRCLPPFRLRRTPRRSNLLSGRRERIDA
jgi:hypothetical protein